MKTMKLLTITMTIAVLSCMAQATVIEEISVDSVDTQFFPTANPMLGMNQTGITVVLEGPGNVQTNVPNVNFQFWTFLQSDNSAGGQAVADFTGGGIGIYDSLNNPLLLADVSNFSLEESTSLPITVFAGSGSFNVIGGSWASDFVPNGVIVDLTWKIADVTGAPVNVSDFKSSFIGESDLTLTVPEPGALALLALGGLALIRRRRRAHC